MFLPSVLCLRHRVISARPLQVTVFRRYWANITYHASQGFVCSTQSVVQALNKVPDEKHVRQLFPPPPLLPHHIDFVLSTSSALLISPELNIDKSLAKCLSRVPHCRDTRVAQSLSAEIPLEDFQAADCPVKHGADDPHSRCQGDPPVPRALCVWVLEWKNTLRGNTTVESRFDTIRTVWTG